MPIHRAKSVEELYEDCRDYDLVLVPDPPLASALNRRLEQAHFGPFAITPRRLAAGRRGTAEDRIAFLEVIEETDLSWKEAAYAIGNVLQCWDNRGEPEALLTKVQSIVGNDDYAIEEDGELRAPTLGDIAVPTRTRDFGRELLHVAEDYSIPMAYDGGIELFRTDQAKLLLA